MLRVLCEGISSAASSVRHSCDAERLLCSSHLGLPSVQHLGTRDRAKCFTNTATSLNSRSRPMTRGLLFLR